ncbi:MAG: hypothetical protein HJJLKODD_02588 [Phycisphaerae bacterium]|nr:hypothetical protein [Phycisphaerae bacterium]
MPQYVILHHVGHGPDHWDLMLEGDRTLLTWKLYHAPEEILKKQIPLQRLPDHRLDYLDYEGAVSGNRGEVRRVDRGELQLLESRGNYRRFKLTGRLLVGEFEIVPQNETDCFWRMIA